MTNGLKPIKILTKIRQAMNKVIAPTRLTGALPNSHGMNQAFAEFRVLDVSEPDRGFFRTNGIQKLIVGMWHQLMGFVLRKTGTYRPDPPACVPA